MTENKEDIRDRLLVSAMALYAEKGLDGVSLREIGVSAGAKNSGVMQYHFGSKLGLLNAIVEKISLQLMPLRAQNPPHEADGVWQMVRGTIENMATLSRSYSWGEDALKVMSRMLMETGTDTRDIINRYFSEQTLQLFERLQTFYPHAEPNKLKLRLLVALDGVIHSLSEAKSLPNSPLGEIRFFSDKELGDELCDFVVGGLTYKL
ncbi:TetR/AcrR family transcriptional regulator [Oceanicoccus sagamiensis]|uniref:TetR/AcrR family transcriptional regulator n=1 Tax=Oceanicoccus sagamiensis TaxID=716816 RepID=UPI00146D23E3|nr:TetR/AcrR family transcriptional regulator [Oceanicoccus sagamiensis]